MSDARMMARGRRRGGCSVADRAETVVNGRIDDGGVWVEESGDGTGLDRQNCRPWLQLPMPMADMMATMSRQGGEVIAFRSRT